MRDLCMAVSARSILFVSALLLFKTSALVAVDLQPTSKFVELKGLRLHYLDWGGRGDVLLFIPAGCDTPYVFGDVAPAFVDRFRVLGLTPRGCGASDRPDTGYDMETQISDIVGFLDALGIRTATLASHSMGGGRITQFARRHPLLQHRHGQLLLQDNDDGGVLGSWCDSDAGWNCVGGQYHRRIGQCALWRT